MKEIINFNHVAETLSSNELDKYTRWYKYYHKLYTCYRWKHKINRRRYIALKMSAMGLVVIGGVAGAVTVNPIVLGCISGPGVLIEGYLGKSNLRRKVEMSRFAATSYLKILTEIRNFIRGVACDDIAFLTDCKVISDIVADWCPAIDDLYPKYEKIYQS